MTKIVLIDDHAAVRWGFAYILKSLAPEMELVAVFAEAAETMNWLRSNPVDVAVVDINLDGRSGLELVDRIRGELPDIKVVIYSGHTAEEFALRGFRLGAVGFLNKGESPEVIVRALREIARTGRYISNEAAELLRNAVQRKGAKVPHDSLPPRQLEIFYALLRGDSVTQIARTLNLSVKTVSSHRAQMMKRIGVNSIADLVRYAIEHKLNQ